MTDFECPVRGIDHCGCIEQHEDEGVRDLALAVDGEKDDHPPECWPEDTP